MNLVDYYAGRIGAEELSGPQRIEIARGGGNLRYANASGVDNQYLRDITDYYGGSVSVPTASGGMTTIDNPQVGAGGYRTVPNPAYVRAQNVQQAYKVADFLAQYLPPDRIRQEVYNQTGVDVGEQSGLSTPKGREKAKELTGLADTNSQIAARDAQRRENELDAAKKARELQQAPVEARNTVETAVSNLDRLKNAASSIMDNESLWRSVGLVGWLPNMPGSAAADITSDIASLKSQVAFGALQAMRDASKTGGALGNVSDTEVKRLESTMAALDEAQSPAQFRQRLNQIINQVDVSQNRLTRTYRDAYPKDEANLRRDSGVSDAPPVSAVSKMKEGVPTTFKNGQVWILESGKPKRVK